jgi:hypothetical protein
MKFLCVNNLRLSCIKAIYYYFYMNSRGDVASNLLEVDG